MKHIIVYGSLKKGKYNFGRFPGQSYLRSIILEGFEMYDTGRGYPAICQTKYPTIIKKQFVRAELHQIENEDSFKKIKVMEIGAGYHELKFDKSLTNASLFVMDRNKLRNCKKIESGEWN